MEKCSILRFFIRIPNVTLGLKVTRRSLTDVLDFFWKENWNALMIFIAERLMTTFGPMRLILFEFGFDEKIAVFQNCQILTCHLLRLHTLYACTLWWQQQKLYFATKKGLVYEIVWMVFNGREINGGRGVNHRHFFSNCYCFNLIKDINISF